MKIAHRHSLTTYFLLFLGVISYVHAAGSTAEQQEINQALEMMKQQGMDPEQTQQMENIFKNMSEMGARQEAAQASKEQQEFEAATAGYGTAQVEVEGKRYDLKFTKCEVKDAKKGVFTIQARQAPHLDDGELSIYNDGTKLRQSISFSTNSRPAANYHSNNLDIEFDGQALSWQGPVESNQRRLPMTLSLKCGAEAVFYDTATRERPDTAANVVTLYLGPETYEFEAGRCSSEAYHTGNWEVFFEAIATGSFRGRPAILLLHSGRGVSGTESHGVGESHKLDLLLGEITPEQRKMSISELERQLAQKISTSRKQQMAAHENKYGKAYWDQVPPAEMAAALEITGAEMDAIMAKADAMRFPSADSHEGMTMFNEEGIIFRGPPMRTNDADRAPAFKDLSATPEVFVTCSR